MMAEASATIDLPAAHLGAALRQTAEDLGLAIREEAEQLSLRLALGTLTVTPVAAGARLELAAADAARLQTLRDTVAERLANAAPGIAVRWSDGVRAGDRPANVSRLDVAAVARISPSFWRLRLAGDVSRFADPGNGLHFRLLFGPENHVAPELDAAGLTAWPGGIGAWHRPTYTVRAVDAQAGWLEADVFVHDGGRTSHWCATARPGMAIALSGPGGGSVPQAGWIGLVGDETALPVIARMLEAAAPQTRGYAVIFIPDAADAQDIAGPAGVRLRYARRDSGETPVAALAAMDLPARDRFVFFAAERSEARMAKDQLAARGLDRAEFRTAAYWTAKA